MTSCRLAPVLFASLFLCLDSSAWGAESSAAPLPPSADRRVSFIADIKPVLETKCLQCHGRGREKGGFKLDTRETLLEGGDSGPVVQPGQSAQSLLIQLVSSSDPEMIMPKKGKPLTPQQIGLLRAWIDQGVEWDGKINFARQPAQNLVPHTPTFQVALSSRVNPIDQILQPYFQKAGVSLPRPVDDPLFARRAFLDAIGRLPTAEELARFLQDPPESRREALIVRLLADKPSYAEHWLSFWNDLLRNDYKGTGYIDGGRKQITSWLYQALLQNVPYDRFVRELINPTSENEGFIRGIVWRGVVNASQVPEMQAAQNVAQVFMGVNLKCASCHDSFINSWRLADSYNLASVFAEGPLEMFECDKPTGRTATPAFLYPQVGEIPTAGSRGERLKGLADLITSPRDGRLPRTIVNRVWARFFGRGLVEPVDDMEQKAWSPDLLDWLAEDLAGNGFDLKRTIKSILTSTAYQLPGVDLPNPVNADYVFQGPAIRRLTAEQFRDALTQVTGIAPPKAQFFPDTNRIIRASLTAADPLATALGRPNREQVISVRAAAATTLQALELTNGKTLADILRFAGKGVAQKNDSAEEIVRLIYRSALSREPVKEEIDAAVECLGNPIQAQGVEDVIWAVTMLPEFQLIY